MAAKLARNFAHASLLMLLLLSVFVGLGWHSQPVAAEGSGTLANKRTPTKSPIPAATALTPGPASTPPGTSTTTASNPTATATPRGITTTLTLYPEADAYVEQGAPDANRGTSPSLLVDGSPALQSYLRFAVSGVTAPVLGAKLRLYVYGGSVDGPAVYATSSNWAETAITWNNRPQPTGLPLSDLGAVGQNLWTELDVTSLVVGGGAYSFVLIPSSGDGMDTYSREGAYSPQLVLTLGLSGSTPTFTAAPATNTPTRTVTQGVNASTPTGTNTSSPSPTRTNTRTYTPSATRTSVGTPTNTPVGSAGVSYYLDDVNGNDANPGTSPSSAWRSLSRAGSASLAPGDSLLLKRGGNWSGHLRITSSGTASAPIAVGAYGDAALPLPAIRDGSSCLDLRGSYLIAQELHLDGCSWAGAEIAGSYNRLQNSLISNNPTGVEVKEGAMHNAILSNQVRDNNRMFVLTEFPTNDDSGAFGILLHGDYTEVAHNTISGSDAFSYDYGRDGAAVEVHGGTYSHIHHNLAFENDAFTELGDPRSANNKYAYNVVRSSLTTSVFLVTRGAESGHGPVLGTELYNNTVLLSGTSSQGFVCHAGCSPQILRMRNNIIEAVWKAGYADAPFDEDYNVYYGGIRQFSMGPNSLVADPHFVNVGGWDLHLQGSSPAVDRGQGLQPGYASDFDGVAVPQDGDGNGLPVVDMGAYEFRN